MEKKKSKLRTVANAIAYVIVFALIAALIFVLFANISGKTVFVAGKTTMWVKTDSMEPAVPERSYVLIKKTSADEVSVGDIIVFTSDDPTLDGANNMHRVVEIKNGGSEFVTKGDNNSVEDAYTAKADKIVGVYVKNLPVLSEFGRFFTTKAGLIVTVIVILGIMAAVYLPDMIKSRRESAAKAAKEKQEQIDRLVREEVEKLKAENDAASDDRNKPQQ